MKQSFKKLIIRFFGLRGASIRWALEQVSFPENCRALNIACGNSAENIKLLLSLFPAWSVTSVDFSRHRVEQADTVNIRAVETGRCQNYQYRAGELHFDKESFDLIMAFENCYYWPNMDVSLRQIIAVLRPGGRLLIANEICGENSWDGVWEDAIDGMNVYTPSRMSELMRQAGFTEITTTVSREGWLCATAVKPI